MSNIQSCMNAADENEATSTKYAQRQHPTLLTLPAEIRNEIYRHYVKVGHGNMRLKLKPTHMRELSESDHESNDPAPPKGFHGPRIAARLPSIP